MWLSYVSRVMHHGAFRVWPRSHGRFLRRFCVAAAIRTSLILRLDAALPFARAPARLSICQGIDLRAASAFGGRDIYVQVLESLFSVLLRLFLGARCSVLW